MTFDKWLKQWEAENRMVVDVFAARAAWDAATEQEQERCDEIRDAEARDLDC